MKRTIIILSVAALASCSPKIVGLTQADADKGTTKFPGLTVEELKHGKAIYETKCTICHGAKRPSSETEASWRKIVPEMAAKAKKNNAADITAADQEAILKYVITMGTASK